MKTIQLIGNFVKKEIDTTVFQMRLLDDSVAYSFSETAIVRLIIENANLNVVNKLVTIKDYANGVVEFDINEGLADGTYNCEFIVYDDEQVMTFPTSGYQTFQINRNLERDATGETITPTEYEIVIERIESIESMLTSKANATHTHIKSEITDFAHTHSMDEVEGLIDTFADQQGLINALDLETDDLQTQITDNVARLDYIQNSVTATETLVDRINALPDNAGNFVEVAKVQGNTVQNLVVDELYYHTQVMTGVEDGDYVIIDSVSEEYPDATTGNVITRFKANLLKPNTTYTVIFNEVHHASRGYIIRDETNATNIQSYNDIISNKNMGKFTTLETVGDYFLLYYTHMVIGEKAKVANNIIILEGDWTNRTDTPDYFTGIQSVQDSVQVKSIGKNLCNINDYAITTNYNNGDTSLIEFSIDNDTFALDLTNYANSNTGAGFWIPAKLKKQCYYTLTWGEITGTFNNIRVYKSNMLDVIFACDLQSNGTVTFYSSNEELVYFRVWANGLSTASISNIMIEEGNVATAYEPYQESTMQIPLAEPLRALPNGVCDYIADGKIVRNTNKVEFDINDDTQGQIGAYTHANFETYTDYLGFVISNSVNGITNPKYYPNAVIKETGYSNVGVVAGLFNALQPTISSFANSNVFLCYHSSGHIYGSIKKTLLETQDMDGVRKYFKNIGHVEFVYELATPIIEDLPIPNDAILQTYQNGHILLENTPVRPKIDVQYPIGLQGKILKIETEIAETEDLLDNLFDAGDVEDYWNGGTA